MVVQLQTLAESTNVKILKEEIKKKEAQHAYLQGSMQSCTRSPAQNLHEEHSARSRSKLGFHTSAQMAPAAQELPCLSCPAIRACSSTSVSHTEQPASVGDQTRSTDRPDCRVWGLGWHRISRDWVWQGGREDPSQSYVKAAAAQAQELEKSPKRNLLSAAVLV